MMRSTDAAGSSSASSFSSSSSSSSSLSSSFSSNQSEYFHHSTYGTSECKKTNCGEAGCLMHNGKPRCYCIDPHSKLMEKWTIPDHNLKCNRTVRNPIRPGSEPIAPPNGLAPFPVPPGIYQIGGERNKVPLMSTTSQLLDLGASVASAGQNNNNGATSASALPAAAAAGCASVFMLVVIAVVILIRRRPLHVGLELKRKANPVGGGGGQSPVVWLQRHDGNRLFDRLTIVTSNEAYYSRAGGDLDDSVLVNVQTKLIPIDDLKLEKEIGEGTFGKVYKGVVTSGFGENSVTEVAVKILKEDVSHEMRDDFRREVEIMSSFDHENILKLLGVVSTEFESPYMVFEFMEFGDLTDILRRNDPTVEASSRTIELKNSDLVDISLQIVKGMLYLSSRRFVHRDLATRNCLVGSGLVIKIADFGMSRDLYTCDYYKVGGNRHLPVRWMAPESIKYGRYGTETDVWSYGVVLWEICAYGRQPYYGHSNEEAIRFIEEGILLQKPSGCSDTVYHVMLGCWRRDSQERFTFQRIHRHLVEYEKNRKQ